MPILFIFLKIVVLQKNQAVIEKLNREVDDLKKNRSTSVRQPSLTRNLKPDEYEDDFPVGRVSVISKFLRFEVQN